MLEISTNIKNDIDTAVIKYLSGALTGNTYKFKNTNRYIKIEFIRPSNVLVYDTKRDISLGNYIFKVLLYEYDNDVLEANVYLEKWITLPELYMDSWVRCSPDEFNNAKNEYHKIINQYYGKEKE